MKKIGRVLYNLFLAVIVLLFLAVAGTFLPIPSLFGGQAGNYKIFTVQSGSMEPKIKMGSLIFVKYFADYQVGDVVTLKAGKNTVTHRIAAIKDQDGEKVFQTKGDANEEADAEETPAKNVVGKTFFTLPYVGYPVGYARTKVGFILLVIIPSTIIVYEELYKIKEEIAKKWGNRRERKSNAAIAENVENRIKIIDEPEDVPLRNLVPREKRRITVPRKKII